MSGTETMDDSPTGPTSAASSSDWQARAADAVEATVGIVQERVVRPLLLIARGIVFGIVVAAMALALTVLLSVALVRLLDEYAFPGRVWASEAVVGAFISLIGLVAWTQRRSRKSADKG
ncbi:MAG: hypothetical protein ACRDV4_06785 [Acidimicrobiales bacterium]